VLLVFDLTQDDGGGGRDVALPAVEFIPRSRICASLSAEKGWVKGTNHTGLVGFNHLLRMNYGIFYALVECFS